MQEFIVSKADSGQTAVKYVERILKNAGLSFIYKQIRKKNIVLNSAKMTGKEKLKEGDSIKIFMTDETISKFSASEGKIDTALFEQAYDHFKTPEILYEDEHILIINKPVGLLSQSDAGSDTSVNEWLLGYLLKTGQVDAASLGAFKPSICNRLDRNTGGLITFGKTLFGTNTLNECFRDRSVKKYYLTIVKGKLNNKELIKGYLRKDEKANKVEIRKDDPKDSSFSYIETEYEPLKYNEEKDITLLRVHLITGKTHQIRAHLSYINHPVIGDNKYGGRFENRKYQFLYCYELTFPETESYKEISGKTIKLDMSKEIQKYFKEN